MGRWESVSSRSSGVDITTTRAFDMVVEKRDAEGSAWLCSVGIVFHLRLFLDQPALF
jgi:hypothetical protein